jgi:hypothetical protein
MSAVIGNVASIDGEFYVKGPDGSLHELTKGSEVHVGDVIVGADGNSQIDSIIVSLNNGTDVVMLANEQQLFDQSLLNVEFSNDETISEPQSIDQLFEVAVNETNDLNVVDDTNEDDIVTEATDGSIDSTADIQEEFQNIQDNSSDIKAQLRDSDGLLNTQVESTNNEETIRHDFYTDQVSANAKANVADLLSAANNAADAANDAIAAAQDAADTLAANENPTAADIATAQNAIDAADAAIETANNAATTYENAANDAGEVVEDTTAVGNTDNAQTTLTDAVNAEIDDTVVSADLDDVSDTGASNEDNVTSDNTPTINGSAEAGAIVVVTTEIGDIVGTAVADENGNYSITTDPLTDGTHNLNITVTDSLGNSASTTQNITIDTASSDTSSLGITDISDTSGDYSSITMSGTGAEAGNTITIYDESDNAVATATVDEDGNWNADISNLNGTPVNDNEFFKVTETDIAGNETGEVDSTHFWHGSWSDIETDDTDDFVLMGSGDDTLHINDNDLNDSLVADGGTGHDTVVFDGNSSDYTITKNDDGSVTVTENVSTDNDGNNIGDVSELRNIETINFADGTYDVNSGELSQTVTINQDNLNDTQSGFNISAFDAYGNEASISNNSYGFGVAGDASGDNAELGYKEGVGSEKLVVDFDNDVSSVDVSFGWKNSSEDAEITFFKDGVEVGSTINHGGTDGVDAAVTLQPDNGESFDQVVFSAPEGGNHDYMINSISFEHVTSETAVNADTKADDVSLNVSVDSVSEHLTTVLDTEAMAAQGIVDNGDGTYSKPHYEDTAKLMKTETIEVGKAENIRLDDAPEHGTIEIQGADGNWTSMEVGQEYSADSNVRFTPDDSALDGTKDIKIGTFGENEGTRSFTETADLSDWGAVSSDNKSIVFTDGNLTVTTTATGGRNNVLTEINSSGKSQGAGLGVDDTSGGISGSEKIVVSIEGEDVNQVSFTLDGLGGLFDENRGTEVIITAYDVNGDVIDTQGGFRESGSYVDTYDFTTNVPVDHFDIGTNGNGGNFVLQNMTLSSTLVDDVTFTAIAADSTELSLQSDINIESGMQTTDITSLVPASDEPMTRDVKVVDTDAMEAKGALLVDGHWVVQNGMEEVTELPTQEVVDGYDYSLNISAQLSDTDGSETLGNVTVSNLPEGTELVGLTANDDGSYSVEVDENGEASVTLSSNTELDTADLNGIEASVTSTESNGGDTNTVSTASENESSEIASQESDNKEHDQKGNDHEDNGKHLGNDQENNHEDNHHDSDFDFDQHLDFNSLLKSAEDESHHHDSKDSHDDNSFDLGGIIDSRDIGNDIFAHIDDKEESHEHGKDKDHDEHKEEHNEHEHHGKNDDSNEWSLGDFKTEKEYEADNSNRGDNERDGRSEDNGGLMDINTDIHVDNS